MVRACYNRRQRNAYVVLCSSDLGLSVRLSIPQNQPDVQDRHFALRWVHSTKSCCHRIHGVGVLRVRYAEDS